MSLVVAGASDAGGVVVVAVVAAVVVVNVVDAVRLMSGEVVP